MAVERALAIQPPMEQAPKDATCYICLDGEHDGESSSKLMRGCACRGDSAGFVHIECLAELAESKEASGDVDAWIKCGNCKQCFQGALDLEMARRFWRRHRSSQDLNLRYESTKCLAISLGGNGEVDAVNQLLDEASTCVANGKQLLALKVVRATMLSANDQKLEALELLQATLPEAKVCTDCPHLYGATIQRLTSLLRELERYQEAHEMATEAAAFCKAKFGLEDAKTLHATKMYAVACVNLGRVEEAKGIFEDTLTSEIRVLGRDHPQTQNTVKLILKYCHRTG